MVEHVLDNGPPPPLLKQAFDFQAFSVNILDMPAGTIRGMRIALNAYSALKGYTSSVGKTVEWTRQNPGAWEFVSGILRDRLERKKDHRHAATG